MEYRFTAKGEEKAKRYLAELMAKRKEILDAGLDTVEEADCANLTVEDLLEDAIETGFDEDGEALNGYFVTDNYDSDEPYCFKRGEDIIPVINDTKELVEHVCNEYREYDAELNSLFFDIETDGLIKKRHP